MTTLSIPIPAELEAFITKMVKSGKAANKADVVRKALRQMSEDEAVEAVLRAEQELSLGKGLKGNLRDLMKKIK